MSLKEYLEFESKAVEESRGAWSPEFESFCELAQLYEYFLASIKVSNRKTALPAELYLVAINQMYGVVSQLLRRRITDAYALTRIAIEATAIAYRIWEQPELSKVFLTAYPNSNKLGHKSQWSRSPEYQKEFKTGKLFNQPGEVWNSLREKYSLFSAMASHASPGSIVFHEFRARERFSPFIIADKEEISRSWYYLMAAYMGIFKVFFHLLKDISTAPTLEIFEKDFIRWRDKTAVLFNHRAPWIRNKAREFQSGQCTLVL